MAGQKLCGNFVGAMSARGSARPPPQNRQRRIHQIKILKTNPSNLKIDTLCNVLNILNSNDVEEKMTPIILLDEIDHFYQKNDDIAFFDILSIPYLSSCNLKILMISNNSEFDKYILPKIENRKIKISKYVFKPYTHVEINKILICQLTELFT